MVIVLSPLAGFYADLPPFVSFLLFRWGVLSSLGTRWLLRAYDCLRRGCFAKPGPRKSVESHRREIRSEPGSTIIGAPTACTPLIRWRTTLQI